MTDHEFENYLALLSGLLRLNGKQREAISDELRDHLEERLAELLERGVPREQAVQQALNEFGDVSTLATQLADAAPKPSWRRSMAVALATAASIVILLQFNPHSPSLVPSTVSVAVAQDAPNNANTQVSFPSGNSEQLRQLEEALGKRVRVVFHNAPLREVVPQLAQLIGVPVRIDQLALDESAIPTDSEITINLDGVSARAAMNLMLRDVGLTFMCRNGIVLITTPEVCEQALRTSLYPVADLAASSGGAFTDYDSLIELITASIDPDTWQDVGGPGTIHGPYKGCLTISQTESVHQQIAALIQGMRELGQGTDTIAAGSGGWRKSLNEKLMTKMSMEFHNAPLSEVIAALQDRAGVAIELDRIALDAVATPIDIAVTFEQAVELPLRVQLEEMLRELHLAYVLKNEVVMITTPDVARASLTTRIYPVHDMMPPLADVDQSEHEDILEGELSYLISLINTSIAPGDWVDVGGAGDARGYLQRPSLIVSQTDHVHRQIESLLAALRKVKTSKYATSKVTTTPAQLQLVVYPTTASQPDLVVEAIRSYVEPETWVDEGGKSGKGESMNRPSIMAIPASGDAIMGRIIVRQRSSVHRKIRAFLLLLGDNPGGFGGGGLNAGGGFF